MDGRPRSRPPHHWVGRVLIGLARCAKRHERRRNVDDSGSQFATSRRFQRSLDDRWRIKGGKGPRPRPQTWVDGELFDGVVTPAKFDPANGNFDILYLGCPFLDGVPLISESKPGDQDYNGGRWEEWKIINPENCALYSTADRDGDLDTAHFAPTGVYFECPLLPRRGRGRP